MEEHIITQALEPILVFLDQKSRDFFYPSTYVSKDRKLVKNIK